MEIADIEVIAVAAGVLLLIGFTCGYGVRALASGEGRTTANLWRRKSRRSGSRSDLRSPSRKARAHRSVQRGERHDNCQAPAH